MVCGSLTLGSKSWLMFQRGIREAPVYIPADRYRQWGRDDWSEEEVKGWQEEVETAIRTRTAADNRERARQASPIPLPRVEADFDIGAVRVGEMLWSVNDARKCAAMYRSLADLMDLVVDEFSR